MMDTTSPIGEPERLPISEAADPPPPPGGPWK